MLKVENLKKSFGGVKALKGVSFSVAEGSIKAVIGPNGAGKTTLFNIITGILSATSGSIFLDGKQISGCSAQHIARLGVSRTFQNVEVFGRMTVLENVMVGRHIQSRAGIVSSGLRLPWVRREEQQVREDALACLDLVGMADRPDELAANLPLGGQKLLEIARALATNPKILLLDEPAGGLNTRETETLAELILRIRTMGITVILVEHDMNLVMDISDNIAVINFGLKIAEGSAKQVKNDPAVIEAYLGEEVDYSEF
ncbi:MAG: ABC transporter ATP-binding protein [Deltaproteobacteria bacterium]|nr:ABC transporter ATP-binding protein [Deltaproteobacteria bacterium]MBW2069897.1 ABC transporter ATP-binding protein [Deltaproteobacteria bacterium]